MSAAIPPPLSSPGVGARRKGPLPRLPLSAFTPPNSGTSERFPLPPSPSSIQPTLVIDAHAVAPGGDLSKWTQESGSSTTLSDKVGGVVVSLAGTPPADVEKAVEAVRSSATSTSIVAILVPYLLEDGAPSSPPAYFTSDPSSSTKIVLLAVYTRYSPEAVEALKWALEQGFTLDLDIRTNLRAGEGAWQDLEDLLTQAIERTPKGSIILSNILPPPDDLLLPIVKLLTHPTYNDYQSQTAALSLYPNVVVKFLPPIWGEASSEPIDTKEWKRRIKMYIGPALEAFGYQRILFGSSPSSSSSSTVLSVGDWYDLARECFAELGTEQEDIQAVFCDNAKRVYGS